MKISPEKINLIMARKCLSVNEVCNAGMIAKETFKQVKNGLRNPTPKTVEVQYIGNIGNRKTESQVIK